LQGAKREKVDKEKKEKSFVAHGATKKAPTGGARKERSKMNYDLGRREIKLLPTVVLGASQCASFAPAKDQFWKKGKLRLQGGSALHKVSGRDAGRSEKGEPGRRGFCVLPGEKEGGQEKTPLEQKSSQKESVAFGTGAGNSRPFFRNGRE